MGTYKHWVFKLEEVGEPLKRRGRNQEDIVSKIETLTEEIAELKREFSGEEHKIVADAMKDWTLKEVSEAIGVSHKFKKNG